MSLVQSNVVRLELMDKEMRQSAVCKDWFAGADDAVLSFASLHIVGDLRCIFARPGKYLAQLMASYLRRC